MCILHNWRDVYTADKVIFQECRKCSWRRRYMIGYGAVANTHWTDTELADAMTPVDSRAVVRVVVTDAGTPTGIALTDAGTLPPDELMRICDAFTAWEKSSKQALFLIEDSRIRYEFVTVAQLTEG